MAEIVWDAVGERGYETGVDHGVLYIPTAGVYSKGYAWNGLTAVNEKPKGAESKPQYADNIKYLNMISAEDLELSIEAFTYPDEFSECDGSFELAPGITISQQNRKPFGLSYRTKIGNDVEGQDHGYKIHIVYGAQAAPAEKAYKTINDSPEANTFNWSITTTPVPVEGYKPSAGVTISSLDVPVATLAAIESVLYGRGANTTARLPLPAELIAITGPGDGA